MRDGARGKPILLSELLEGLPEEREAFLEARPHPALLLEPFGWEPWAETDPDVTTLAWREAPAPAGPPSLGDDDATPEAGIPTKVQRPENYGADLLGQMLADSLHPSTRLEWLTSHPEVERAFEAVTLGRSRRNDICIPNLSISKTQAVFLEEDGRWLIQDDGSANGTFLNGRRLVSNTVYELTDGDTLSFGMVVKGRFLHPDSLWLLCDKLRRVSGDRAEMTLRRNLEEQLLQAQRMEMIGRLSGSVAHDFNNLLTVIQGHLALLQEGAPDDDPRNHSLSEIGAAAERASDLTRQLLTFSRRQRSDPTAVQLNDVVRRAEGGLRGLLNGSIALELDLDPTLSPIWADPYQLEQVVMNLAINARDAMPSGGTLTIATRNDTAGEQPEVRLSVRDTGSGIDAETLPYIFEPFFTTKEVGQASGLGLSTVYGIVQQSRGHVTVHSDGAGASFEVVFPAEPDAEPAPTATHAASDVEASRGPRSILLVEDEDGVRNLLADVLKGAGYSVHSASCSAEAKLVLQRTPQVDLLLTDIVMPGESGAQLAELVKARLPNVRVIYMSGYTRDAMRDREELSQDEAFLEKPFLPRELLSTVDDVLASVD